MKGLVSRRSILLMLLLSLLTQGAWADRFVAITTAPIGSKLKLTLSGSDITINGLKGKIVYDKESTYEVTAQTFAIEGKLSQIYCYGCNITSIDLSQCPKLEGLGCQGNQLTSLDLTACKSLMLLFCESNPLKRLDVSPCPQLGRLNCVQCDLEELIMTGCKEIFEISCYQNRLKSIDLTGLSNLRWLYCFENKLTEIDTSPCPLLIKVLCEYNQITKLDFSSNPELDEVACQGNNLQGATLTTICQTLPDRTAMDHRGIFMVVDTKEAKDTNVCTVEQVALLKKLGWDAMDSRGGANGGFGVPYEGSQDNAVMRPDVTPSLPQLSLYDRELVIDQVPLGATITIFDLQGACHYQRSGIPSTQLAISTEGWLRGHYLLSVSGCDGQLFSL